MSILQGCLVKCKCGKPANAVKSYEIKRKKIINKKVLILSCKHCGLEYKDKEYGIIQN